MAITEDAVREELKKVIDPELFVNIVDLGLIYTVTIEPVGEVDGAEDQQADPSETEAENVGGEPATEPAVTAEAPEKPAEETSAPAPVTAAPSSAEVNISVEMTMTSPMCPAGPQLVAQSKQVVEAIEGVAAVEVRIVMDPPWTPEKMTDDARDQLGIF